MNRKRARSEEEENSSSDDIGWISDYGIPKEEEEEEEEDEEEGNLEMSPQEIRFLLKWRDADIEWGYRQAPPGSESEHVRTEYKLDPNRMDRGTYETVTRLMDPFWRFRFRPTFAGMWYDVNSRWTNDKAHHVISPSGQIVLQLFRNTLGVDRWNEIVTSATNHSGQYQNSVCFEFCCVSILIINELINNRLDEAVGRMEAFVIWARDQPGVSRRFAPNVKER